MATYHPKKQLWEARRRYVEAGGVASRRSFWGRTEEEAEAQAQSFIRLRTDIHDGTLASFAVNGYAPTITHLSRKWREQVTWALDRHILPAYGDRLISDISRAEVQLFLNLKTEKLSLTSVRHIRKIFVAVMNLAEQDELVRRNVVAQTKLATPPEAEKVIYTPAQCAAFIEANAGTVWQPALFLGAFLGMRLGECLGLKMEDVTHDSLRITHQAQKLGGEIALRPPKTRSSVRTIPLPEGFYARLMGMRSYDGSLVCSNVYGGVLDPENASRAMENAARRAQLKTATFHHLRSSFSTNMDEFGCPVRAKKELMGHAAKDVTEGYSRAYDETKRRFLGMLLSAFDAEDRLLVVRPPGGRKNNKSTSQEGPF